MDKHSRLPALAIAITVLVGTSACSSQAEKYTDLTEESASEKPLPEAVRTGSIDLESTRWVGEHEGTELWLGLAADEAGMCLAIYPDPERWVTGCSSGDEVNVSNGDGWDYRVRPDNIELPDGAVPVSHNVFVTDR